MLTLVTTILLVTGSLQDPEAQQPSEVTLSELRSDLRALERSFGGLKVEAEYTWHRRDPIASEFVYNGGLDGTLWFSSKPGGRARCDVRRQIGPWVRGPSDFAETSYLSTFDGRVGQVLKRKTGAKDQAFPIKRAIFVSHRPSHAELGARTSGWRLSTLGFFDQVGGRFSEMLDVDRDRLTIETFLEGTSRRVRLQRTAMLGELMLRDTWILDPGRSYALLDYQYQEGDAVTEHIAVEHLAESQGLYWPTQATRLSRMADGAEIREEMRMQPTTLSFEDVAAVDWHVALPAGTTLEDPVSDVVLTIGYRPDELEPLLDADADLLVNSLAESESIDAACLRVDPTGVVSPARIALLVGGLLLVGFGIVRWIATARHASRQRLVSVAAVAMAFLFATQVQAQQVSLAADELGAHRIHNCGVNASAVILRAFGKESDLDAIALGLDCGDHWERVVSLGQLSALFEARGLHVEPMQQLSPEQMLTRLGHGKVAVVHLASASLSDGHFIVLGGTRRDQVFEIDPTRSARWVEVSKFLAAKRNLLSGYGLLVSERASPQAGTMPRLPTDAATMELDMGDVSELQGIVTASVRVHNERSEPMSLATSASSCTCFQGAAFESGQKAIPPGRDDVLCLQFDRAKIGLGETEQHVVVALEAGASKRDVMFRVRSRVRSTEVSRRVAAMPEAIDWGIVRDQTDLGVPRRVSLQLPDGVVVVSAKASAEHIQVQRVRSTNDRGSQYRAPSRTETFEVSILSQPTEYLREEILFVLSDPQLKTMRIPVLSELSESR